MGKYKGFAPLFEFLCLVIKALHFRFEPKSNLFFVVLSMRYLLALVIVVSFFSCKRDKEKFVVSGILYKDCSHTIPYANYPLILEYNTKSITEDPFEVTLNTNEKGEFSATYESVSDLINGNLSVSFVAGFANTSLVSDLPLNKTVDLGNVVKGLNCFVVYKISTKKAYTANDTLFYRINSSNFSPPYKMNAPYKVGPFTDGQILDTLVRSSLMGYDKGSESIKIQEYSEWRLGALYKDPNRLNQQIHLINPCHVYEEAVIDLERAVK